MGRLAGFNYKKCIKKLRTLGFEFDRGARGIHEIWWNRQTRARTTIPNHPWDIPKGTMKAILKQAGVDTDDFLNI